MDWTSRVHLDQLGTADLPYEAGRYRLLEVLGEGGMARVFRAELHGSEGFRRQVALKVIRSEIAGRDAQLRRSLINEARVGGLLHHGNVVQTWDFCDVDGQPAIAMELVRGPTLAQLLEERGPLPPEVAIEVIVQACRGVEHAHALAVDGKHERLVHRDLKPSNLLINGEGVVKVADFGLAKGIALTENKTKTGESPGTASYMAPEQATGGDLDARTDLFALATVLYESVVGRRLLAGMPAARLLFALIQVEARLADPATWTAIDAAMPGLRDVLYEGLRREPDDRFADVSAFRAALESLVADRPRVDLAGWLAGAFEEEGPVAESAASSSVPSLPSAAVSSVPSLPSAAVSPVPSLPSAAVSSVPSLPSAAVSSLTSQPADERPVSDAGSAASAASASSDEASASPPPPTRLEAPIRSPARQGRRAALVGAGVLLLGLAFVAMRSPGPGPSIEPADGGAAASTPSPASAPAVSDDPEVVAGSVPSASDDPEAVADSGSSMPSPSDAHESAPEAAPEAVSAPSPLTTSSEDAAPPPAATAPAQAPASTPVATPAATPVATPVEPESPTPDPPPAPPESTPSSPATSSASAPPPSPPEVLAANATLTRRGVQRGVDFQVTVRCPSDCAAVVQVRTDGAWTEHPLGGVGEDRSASVPLPLSDERSVGWFVGVRSAAGSAQWGTRDRPRRLVVR